MKDFSIKAAFKFGWQKTRDNFGFVFVVMVCYFLLGVANHLLSPSYGPHRHFVMYGNAGLALLSLFTYLALVFISILFSIGVIKLSLHIIDSKPIKFRELLSHTEYFWRLIGSSLVTKLIALVGFILLIVPGIIWSIMFFFAPFLVVDQNLGVMDSIYESQKLAHGVKWKLFGFFLLLILLNAIGAIAVVIGLIITMPITLFSLLYVYRTLLEQTVQGSIGPSANPSEGDNEVIVTETIIIEESPTF